MKKYYVLINKLAGSDSGNSAKLAIEEQIKDGEIQFIDIAQIKDYKDFFKQLDAGDAVVLCGGDGTLNRFVNDTDGADIKCEILYYPAGSGNDFYKDVAGTDEKKIIAINEYIKDLPEVFVKGESYKFLNNVGYGIDGYCCEEGDRLRDLGKKNISYTSIAIKGVLGKYKLKDAEVEVDGQTYKFKKVLIAPTMNGKYYGGGMMPAPNQDRKNKDGIVSLMVMHGCCRLKGLMIFPSIFTGKHVKHEKYVKIIEGHNVTVRFNKPSALQIDGETILGVTEYKVVSKCRNAEKVATEEVASTEA